MTSRFPIFRPSLPEAPTLKNILFPLTQTCMWKSLIMNRFGENFHYLGYRITFPMLGFLCFTRWELPELRKTRSTATAGRGKRLCRTIRDESFSANLRKWRKFFITFTSLERIFRGNHLHLAATFNDKQLLCTWTSSNGTDFSRQS